MPDEHPNTELIALGVRQPWAELILRGKKTIEVRSQSTNMRGTIYLYASKKFSKHAAAENAFVKHRLQRDSLPLGLIVGTVDIVESRPCRPADADSACVTLEDLDGRFSWHLENAVRFDEPIPVRYLPYGVWFYPFRRRSESR